MHALSPRILVVLAISTTSLASAQASPCGEDVPCGGAPYPVYQREPAQPSWIFNRSTYTHDLYTGARVAQYQRLPAIEPLDDQRLVTSRYRRVRTNLRGRDGSTDSTYDVQSWGNGRGGLDAEWERFHDAWKESELTGGYFNQQPGFGGGFPWWGGGFPHGGIGYPGFGFGGPTSGHGFPQGYGQGPHGGSWNGPWQHGPGPHGGGPHNNGQHGSGQHGQPQGHSTQDE
jgi:hypothetical protein